MTTPPPAALAPSVALERLENELREELRHWKCMVELPVESVSRWADELATLRASLDRQGEAVDTGNFIHDPLYKALDELYGRGWTDLHKGRDYDPRGTNEWGAVLELFRKHRATPAAVAADEAMAVRAITARNEYLRKHPGEALPAMMVALTAALQPANSEGEKA